MTTHFVGRFPQPDPTVAACALEAGDRVTFDPFEVVLDRVFSFPRDRGEAPGVFASSSPPNGLLSVATQLRAGMAGVTNSPRKREVFRPHVTWLYSTDRMAETAIDPIAWRVTEFALAHTIPGQQRYQILRCWPLR